MTHIVNKHAWIFVAICLCLAISCSQQGNDVHLESEHFILKMDDRGYIRAMSDKTTQHNYLYDTLTPLLQIRVNGHFQLPGAATWSEGKQQLILIFPDDRQATIAIEQKSTHVTCELTGLSRPDEVELIVWGPYPTTIDEIIGETIGVVRGEQFALGIQALNVKTLGGFPWNENDQMPQINIFDRTDYDDFSPSKGVVLYSVEAAKPTTYGSSLQAYCRNRHTDRVIANWQFDQYVAPAFNDGGVIGSKIALFGCPTSEALATIGAIEIAEDLPHPLHDGEWIKTAPSATSAYIILDFSESDVDKAISYTKQAGLKYLYHSDPFDTWGHFNVKERYFPQGRASLRRAVEKANEAGLYVGLHTLSNFITTNDAYVSPVPDPRLAKVGSGKIVSDLDPGQTVIGIEASDFFDQTEKSHLNTVLIGTELIRYGGISEQAPWQLLDCQRGAFGTTASTHAEGTAVHRLADHAYKVFLTDPDLSAEVAVQTAKLFNETGLQQLSFDGLEGTRSTGMGNYAEALFAKNWYDNLDQRIRDHYILDASRSGHFFWHMYTRMNWGEPWYAGFRESQTEYRLKNQVYFDRNMMPNMLGWFKMTKETTIEDIEWLLARSAAFDAGYAFVTNYEVLEGNGFTDEILYLIGLWEEARMTGAFTEAQKTQMQDVNREYHLEKTNGDWILSHVLVDIFRHHAKERQPGEPEHSRAEFTAETEETIDFVLTSENGTVRDITLELDNYKALSLPVTLQQDEHLRYVGGGYATVYNKYWQPLETVPIDTSVFRVARGDHHITADCTFLEGEEVALKIELRRNKVRS